mmetsp:Transcript_23180/g.54251  ORF Transcript_23180/g.54251 Transcript_23180/m.54251 type:complete len:229 (-) Transcript_23180:924-1610(-)
MSYSVSKPLMSITDMRVLSQLPAMTCGLQWIMKRASIPKCGKEYRWTMPLSRATKQHCSVAVMHAIGSCAGAAGMTKPSLSWNPVPGANDSSMWNIISTRRLPATPSMPAVAKSPWDCLVTLERYIQMYTTSSEATTTCEFVMATCSGSMCKYLESTGLPISLHTMMMYCPLESSAFVTRTQYSSEERMCITCLMYLVYFSSPCVSQKTTTCSSRSFFNTAYTSVREK